MKRLIFTFLLCVALSILLASCNNTDENLVDVDQSNLNSQIILNPDDVHNTYKTDDSIVLYLLYNSTNEIVFPRDFNVTIFERTKDGWVKINELPTIRKPDEDIVLSPNKMQPIAQIVFVNPDLQRLDQAYQLRIYVIGEMKDGEKTVKVGAYADVKLHP